MIKVLSDKVEENAEGKKKEALEFGVKNANLKKRNEELEIELEEKVRYLGLLSYDHCNDI